MNARNHIGITGAEIQLPPELVEGIRTGVRQTVQGVLSEEGNPLSGEDICESIYEAVSKATPFTQGMEGDIYKINIGGRLLVVVKKRKHDGGNEYGLHREALKILSKSLSHTSLVSIPKLYGRFDEAAGEHSYLVMEFIQGKTLYNLMCASVIDYWKQKGVHNARIANALAMVKIPTATHLEIESLPRGLSISPNHEKRTGISFEHDAIAEETMQSMYEQLLREGVIQDIGEKKNHRLFRDIKEAPVFTELEFSQLKGQIADFLKLLHDDGFYHRDIADNPRNIMFGDDGRVYFIDFGRSKKIPPGSTEEVYTDTKSGGMHTDDNYLLPYLKNLSSTPRISPLAAIAEQIEARKGAVNMDEMMRISTIYGISNAEMIAFFSGMNYGSSIGALSQNYDKTHTSQLHLPSLKDGFFYDWKSKNLFETKRYAMRLIAQLALLDRKDLLQLRDVIAEKKNKNPKFQEIYLMYIDQFLNAQVVSEAA